MRTNSSLILRCVALGALFCGFVGMVIGALLGTGTNVLLPGLGLIVAGSLVLGLVIGLAGAALGSLLGLFVAVIIILTRRNTYP
jgi:hypothetical protein